MQKKKYVITDKINFLLFSFIILINIFQFFLLPFYLLPQNQLWALSIVLLIPFNNTMWFLIHEAIHRNLNSNSRLNEYMGRILSIVFGASFQGLTFGHMLHHGLNRRWESEFYDKSVETTISAKAKYYFKIFFGVYLTEVIGSLVLCFFSKGTVSKIMSFHDMYNSQLRSQIENYFYRRDRIIKLRTDMYISAIFFTSSLLIFGKLWPVFFAIIILRAISISLMDNIFHYGTPPDNSIPGKQVKANKLLSLIILNANYHGTHHSHPDIPWIRLPHESGEPELHEKFFESMRGQFNGPILQ